MSDTVTIRNKSADERSFQVNGVDVTVEPGGTIEVAAEVAHGVPPSGDEGSPEYRAGTTGLLVHSDQWELVKSPKTRPADTGEGE